MKRLFCILLSFGFLFVICTACNKNNSYANTPVNFLPVKLGCENLKQMEYNTQEWELVSYGEFLFAQHVEYPFVIRYNIAENQIDKVAELSRDYYIEAFSSDGKMCIVDEINKVKSGIDISRKFLIDFEKECSSETQESTFLSDCKVRPIVEKTEGNYYISTSGGEKRKIASLQQYAYSLGVCTAIDENRIGAILPQKDIPGKLGYYHFALIDTQQDIILQECPINP